MALVVSLKHIDELSGGRKRFRRRWPKDVGEALGEQFMQRPMKAREGAALVTERETLLKEFDATVAAHRRSQEKRDSMSPRQRWGEALGEAERLTSGIVGDVEGAMDALADEAQRNEDQLLYRAIKAPEAENPKPTLADAFDRYAELKIDDSQGRNPRNRLDRVRKRTEKALGKLNALLLDDLRREHGRAFLNVMKEAKTSTGKPLSSETIKRELNMLAAITEIGLVEFDLAGVRANPFRRLETKRPGEAPSADDEARLPLPPEVIAEVRHRLATKAKTPDLLRIWQLCEGTGARPGEVAGLRVEDVHLDHETPHIRVEWHEDRRVKTAPSIRWVPLVGDALEAAKEAAKAAKGEALLFDHYAREDGSARLSAIMNKHVRAATKDRRHVFYSLRHNMKDRLVASGADQRTENRLLGHTAGGIGDRVYGSKEAWLKVAAEAMRKAHGS